MNRLTASDIGSMADALLQHLCLRSPHRNHDLADLRRHHSLLRDALRGAPTPALTCREFAHRVAELLRAEPYRRGDDLLPDLALVAVLEPELPVQTLCARLRRRAPRP